ncbi:MAG: argininosuccinate lyase [Kiritimatiellae bacterium]|nr:argininosuccinate lyase [Kiritimatiellia bacterium]
MKNTISKHTAGVGRTMIGTIRTDVLAYTAGKDVKLDMCLVDADCIGSAAHVTMLAGLPLKPHLFSARDRDRVIAELARIMRRADRGAFTITLQDQDVHLAVERELTSRLGALGRKIHTGRSRNDQVAVDLRLFAKEQLLAVIEEALALGSALLIQARRNRGVAMVGRTHLQPAMPSSVGLWASAYTEDLLDDIRLLKGVYDLNDQCPLGSAAGYGVPLPLDRRQVSDLLGFRRPIHNVLHAGNSRGKLESGILSALSQVMITLSRLSEDLMLFMMPEFDYFSLSPDMCTGSSIMPQKNNPDVLELVRARTARVMACNQTVMDIIKGLPSGYNRDLQETKEPFMLGMTMTRASLRIMASLVAGLKINREALRRGFTPAVFAADHALSLVARGMPFRDAYHYVKKHLDELDDLDPDRAIALKTHAGATAGLDFAGMARQLAAERASAENEKRRYFKTISRLLRIPYPM